MVILGLNAYYGDSSACIVVDGKLIAAAEEEKFTRVKHWAGFPTEAILFCLNEAGVEFQDIDHIAVNRNPHANLWKKASYLFSNRPSLKTVSRRLKNAYRIKDIGDVLNRELNFLCQRITAEVHKVEHHVAHLSSAFFVSPFKEASMVSLDCFGDFVGTMWGKGLENMIEVGDRVFFPHSLGLFYLALTQFLGFLDYGDEHKVMELAVHGEPEFMEEMAKILRIEKRGGFSLDLDFFTHHSNGIPMTWEEGGPSMKVIFSERLERLLGPPRRREEEITQRHKNIAASLQKRYEEVFFHVLNMVYRETKSPDLVLSGGCALNSLANGKILANTPFRDVYIQPAAGDAGGAVGAAFFVWNQELGMPRSYVLDKPYLGPRYSNYKIEQALDGFRHELESGGYGVEKMEDPVALCRNAARAVAEGRIVGWFQGRLEWGPEGLGNRSIVCDPRRSEMKDVLNSRIRRREPFRSFAPSIHHESLGEYFEAASPNPFMLHAYKVRPDKRDLIPAVIHADGTCIPHTVKREDNPLYWQLIEEFRRLTSLPVVLKGPFSENEPTVCSPEDALKSLLRREVDILVIGDFFLTGPPGLEKDEPGRPDR